MNPTARPRQHNSLPSNTSRSALSDESMAQKIGKISGFPEWLPEEKIIEDRLISTIKKVYESFGFCPVETPAVELISTLKSKGVVDKEIYAVRRLQDDGSAEAELALHFDLTVPFARYVAQHNQKLVFPFKRYQLQKVWRGDRPQKGRFREFYQFDIDTIAREILPISCDAEALTALDAALSAINIGKYTIRINSRKVLSGFYGELGLNEKQVIQAITAVDKLDKIKIEGVRSELAKIEGISEGVINRIADATSLKIPVHNLISESEKLGVKGDLFQDGIDDLLELVSLMPPDAHERMVIDFSLARGLAYYTGTIVEVALNDHPEFGTVASGGRYENLAADFTDEKLPGVGFSIGLTRLMDLILSEKLINAGRRSPCKVLVSVISEDVRIECNQLAAKMRSHGIPCEVYFRSPKLGKQIDYAESKGIRYVAFVNNGSVEIKDLVTKQQGPMKDLTTWAAELREDES